jgi:hypothetical protein
MRERESATGERRQPTTTPTAYSYYKSATVTETFSLAREEAWMFSLKECSPELTSSEEVNMNPEHLYCDRGSLE